MYQTNSTTTSKLIKPSISKRIMLHRRTSSLLACTLGLLIVGCSNSETAQAEQTANVSAVTTQLNSADGASTNAPIDTISANKTSDATVVAALQANMAASGIEQNIESAIPTQMPGMYWVSASGMPNFFTDAKGKYVIQGQVVELGGATPIDISAKLQADAARSLLAKVDTDDMIIYPALGETKAVVYVFTDADCGYCRKLHSEMPDINNRGIEVRYLAWPRSEQTIPKMEAIWCSDNRNQAMNAAKSGTNISAPSCRNPVAQQVDLGFSLGVNGTPAIFTTSGTNIGGYLPAEELAQAAIAN